MSKYSRSASSRLKQTRKYQKTAPASVVADVRDGTTINQFGYTECDEQLFDELATSAREASSGQHRVNRRQPTYTTPYTIQDEKQFDAIIQTAQAAAVALTTNGATVANIETMDFGKQTNNDDGEAETGGNLSRHIRYFD